MKFEVLGAPCGKGRPRFTRNSHRPYTPETTANYETLVKLAYMQAGGAMFGGPVSLSITAYYPIPKSLAKKKSSLMANGFEIPIIKPDVDNIAKAIMDALNHIAYNDDRQVTELQVRKLYSHEPKTVVEIKEVQNLGKEQ